MAMPVGEGSSRRMRAALVATVIAVVAGTGVALAGVFDDDDRSVAVRTNAEPGSSGVEGSDAATSTTASPSPTSAVQVADVSSDGASEVETTTTTTLLFAAPRDLEGHVSFEKESVGYDEDVVISLTVRNSSDHVVLVDSDAEHKVGTMVVLMVWEDASTMNTFFLVLRDGTTTLEPGQTHTWTRTFRPSESHALPGLATARAMHHATLVDTGEGLSHGVPFRLIAPGHVTIEPPPGWQEEVDEFTSAR